MTRKLTILLLQKTGMLPFISFLIRRLKPLSRFVKKRQLGFFNSRVQDKQIVEKPPMVLEATQKFVSVAKDSPKIRATVVVSLYKSSFFLDSFFKNLLAQTGVDAFEFVFVCVQPNSKELSLINRYTSLLKNVTILIEPTRLAIYEAWNLAISQSSGQYITNWNVDDIRHPDSLESQVMALDSTGADVVYQNFYSTNVPNLDWTDIPSNSELVDVPVVSLRNLSRGINSPHNAPMWRRSLHKKIGFFDTNFLSAGDHDFWIRAAIVEAKFFKIVEPQVAYYLNPLGISTKVDSPGLLEGLYLLHKYRHFA